MDNIINKITRIFPFLLLFLYLAEFPSTKIPQCLTIFFIFSGYYFVTIKLLNKTICHFNSKEIRLLIGIMIVYMLFHIKSYVFGENELYECITRIIVPFILCLILLNFGKNSIDNAIYLTKSFAIFLVISLLFSFVGIIYFGEYISLRYSLYGRYYDTLIGNNISQPSHLLLAGLSSASYLFGYQVAGGTTLFICLFFIDSGYWRVLWGISLLLALIVLVYTAERATVPAIFAGISIFVLYSFRDKKILKKIISFSFIIIFFCIITVFLQFLFNDFKTLGTFKKIYQRHISGKTIFERFTQSDIYTRLEMQEACLEIALENPQGLFFKGMKEESWGRLATAKGYNVVPDEKGEYALVHNGYLRIIMYFGWVIGLLIFYVFLSIIDKIRYLNFANNQIIARYGKGITSTFVTLSTHALFHNDSLFTIERTTWVAFILIFVWYRLARLDNDHLIARQVNII